MPFSILPDAMRKDMFSREAIYYKSQQDKIVLGGTPSTAETKTTLAYKAIIYSHKTYNTQHLIHVHTCGSKGNSVW